jgi:hypothetical protein
LAAAPFTAPYAVCDLNDGNHPPGTDVGSARHDDTLLKFKVVKESMLAGVPAWNVLPPFLSVTDASSVEPPAHADRRPALHSILRL